MENTQNTPSVASGEKIALIGIFANISLALIKFIGGVLGNSYALIADAIESATDIIGSGIVYLGVRYAQKPADDNHPYGHWKVEPMAGLAVSILLVFAVIEIIRWALERLQDPTTGIPATWTLIILIGVVILKGGLFLKEYLIGKKLQSTAIIGDAFHHLSDAITTGIALIGTLLALFAGEIFLQAADYAAIIASLFMCYNIYHIGWPAMRELLDEVDDPELEGAIRALLWENTDIKYINVCIARKSGFDRIIDLHLLVDGEISVRSWHLIAHAAEETIKKRFTNVQSVMVHIEPSYPVIS